ncbi:MAG: beta-agarase [Lautropia sp.]|nr:beta-agarase [Lautropia sp.]
MSRSCQIGRRSRAVAAAVALALMIALSLSMTVISPAQAQLVADLAAPDNTLRIESADVEIAKADGDGFVPVRYQPSGEPALEVRAGADGWNWSGATEVRLHLQNAMGWAVTVQVRITDRAGATLDATVGLPPGGPITLTIPLQATQPRRWGMVAGPPIPWLQDKAPVAVALAITGEVDKRRIAGIRIAMPRPDAPQTLRIGKIFIEPTATVADGQERLAYTRIVDAYGQYVRGEWDEKFRPDARASTDADGAFAAFARSKEPVPVASAGADVKAEHGATTGSADERLDDYGGILGVEVPAQPAAGTKGFFRTARIRDGAGPGRWLLLTPLGNPFFSLGVNAIQLDNSQTFVEGREFMFAELPAPGHPLARFQGRQDSADALPLDAGAQRGRGFGKGKTYDFYRANLYRRDGPDFAAQWLTRTRDRLRQWNFNTIGSWSDHAVSADARIPYTRTIHVAGGFSKLSDGNNWWAGIADPFDPRFAQALERAIEKQARPLKDDPYLIGYFIDNELGWGNGAATDPQVRYALAYSVLGGDANQPHAYAKRALLELLRSRHQGSIQKLSASWQKPLASWEALQAPLAAGQLPDGRIAAVAADLSAFLSLHAQRYFEQVAGTLKRHDPNHLYLGARFASRNPEVLQACATWCDVVSFNLYLPSVNVGFESAAFRKLDKPALLTEFHFGSSDRGPFWHGVMPVPSEADRGPAYARMLKSVLANPDFVGAHWFQYLDQPVTGRWLDGENGHLGLVAITDIPWSGFVADVRESNRRIREGFREQLNVRR